MTKINAFIGSTIKIRSAPTPHPINAPKIGINAVNAINTAINSDSQVLNDESIEDYQVKY